MATPPGLTYSAHAFRRGNFAPSTTSTRLPRSAKKQAEALPAGPPPTTITSYARTFT